MDGLNAQKQGIVAEATAIANLCERLEVEAIDCNVALS